MQKTSVLVTLPPLFSVPELWLSWACSWGWSHKATVTFG